MSKSKAGLSLVTLLLILPIIVFFLILFDILRITQAKQKMELTASKALEAALVEYDQDIYDKYRLMTLKAEDEFRATFVSAMDFTGREESGGLLFPNYKINSVKLRAGAPLSDRRALKTAILKKHEKYFVVNSLETWIKKLEELKKLKPYAKACEAYSEGLNEVLKLKKLYEKLGESYKHIESLEASIKSLDIKTTIEKRQSLERELKLIEKELRELKAEFSGLNVNMHPDKEEEYGTQNSDLAAGIARLKEEAAEKRKELNSAIELIDSLLERNRELCNYYEKVRDFNSKLREAETKIRRRQEEIENISGEADVEEAKELIGKLVEKVNSSLEELEKIEPVLGMDARAGEEQNRSVRLALNRKEGYEGNAVISDSSYANISHNDSVRALFGSWDRMAGETEIHTIMDLIWLAINGELLPDFSDLESPDFTKAPHLPSRDKEAKKEYNGKRFLDRYGEPRPSKEEFSTRALEKTAKSSKELADKQLNFNIRGLFEKMVLAGYITDTFSHYSFKEEDKSKFFSGAEVEYILSGSENPKHNLVMTQLKIFTLRYCLNFVPIALYKAEEIDRISLFLSSFTAGLGYPIYKGIVSLAWCSIETLADLKEINEGRGSVIIKSKKDIITCLSSEDAALDHKELLDRELKKIETGTEGGTEADENKGDGKPRMNYEEHLFLFLLIENEGESLMRIADLIALKEKMDTRQLYTALEADISYDIGLIFPGAKRYFNLKTTGNCYHILKSISSY